VTTQSDLWAQLGRGPKPKKKARKKTTKKKAPARKKKAAKKKPARKKAAPKKKAAKLSPPKPKARKKAAKKAPTRKPAKGRSFQPVKIPLPEAAFEKLLDAGDFPDNYEPGKRWFTYKGVKYWPFSALQYNVYALKGAKTHAGAKGVEVEFVLAGGPLDRSPRSNPGEPPGLDRTCPYCKAKPGELCMSKGTRRDGSPGMKTYILGPDRRSYTSHKARGGLGSGRPKKTTKKKAGKRIRLSHHGSIGESCYGETVPADAPTEQFSHPRKKGVYVTHYRCPKCRRWVTRDMTR
jgi:hypothetical protein